MWQTKRSFIALFAGVTIVVAISATYLLLRGNHDAEGALDAFHFVATLEIQQPRVNGDDQVDRIEAWYEPSEGARWEMSYTDPGRATETGLILLNEDGMLSYDGMTNTYVTYPVPETVAEYPASLPSSFGVGPLPVPDIDTYFNARLDSTWTVRGEEEVLGIRAQVIDVSGSDGQRTTYWIEPKNVFVLRQETTDSMGLTTSVRITELEFNPKLESSLFTFDPPANALEDEFKDSGGNWSSGNLGGPEFPRQEGFLVPSYLPAGYVTKGSGANSSMSRTRSYWITLGPSRDAPETLRVEQQFRAGGLAAPPLNSTTVDVAGRPGYRTTTGSEEVLVVGFGDVIVTLKSTTLPFEELHRIAASMN
jgi:outer membrane lipoprotein-sorting protein